MLLETIKFVNKSTLAQGRLMAFDYGKKNIGIAISDRTHSIAQPHHPTYSKIDKNFLSVIFNLIIKYEIKLIVIGIPLNPDGSRTNPMCQAVSDFQSFLSKELSNYIDSKNYPTNITLSESLLSFIKDMPMIFWDERFSSLGSQKALKETKVLKSKRHQYIDNMSAALILQSFLDYINYNQSFS